MTYSFPYLIDLINFIIVILVKDNYQALLGTLGENSVVGAGMVVTKNVPANSFVAGVPAKVIRFLNLCEFNNQYPKVNIDRIADRVSD